MTDWITIIIIEVEMNFYWCELGIILNGDEKFMDTNMVLEDQLKELKLTKRSFVLEGKNTEELDYKIRLVEQEIKEHLEK